MTKITIDIRNIASSTYAGTTGEDVYFTPVHIF